MPTFIGIILFLATCIAMQKYADYRNLFFATELRMWDAYAQKWKTISIVLLMIDLATLCYWAWRHSP